MYDVSRLLHSRIDFNHVKIQIVLCCLFSFYTPEECLYLSFSEGTDESRWIILYWTLEYCTLELDLLPLSLLVIVKQFSQRIHLKLCCSHILTVEVRHKRTEKICWLFDLDISSFRPTCVSFFGSDIWRNSNFCKVCPLFHFLLFIWTSCGHEFDRWPWYGRYEWNRQIDRLINWQADSLLLNN